MLIWKIFGTLFIISVVVAAICAVCKLVVSLETLRDRTNDLTVTAVRNKAKIDTLADKISQTKDDLRLLNDYQNVTDQTVSEDRAEISALHDHFDDLLKRIENLEKGGAQIERKTGRAVKEG